MDAENILKSLLDELDYDYCETCKRIIKAKGHSKWNCGSYTQLDAEDCELLIGWVDCGAYVK